MNDPALESLAATPEPPGRRGLYTVMFPSGVRLWHFIVLPTLGMGLLIATFRFIEVWIGDSSSPAVLEAYQILRTVVISTAMAGIIAYLAFNYRRDYERKLQTHNTALQETRDYLARILEGSGEAIITLDTEDRVTSWNAAAEKIYGWPATEMLGQDLSRLSPDDPEIVAQDLEYTRRVRSGGTLNHHETERLRMDGQRIVVHITLSPLYGADDEFTGSVAMLHDVTHLRELQLKLNEQERLAAVGQLAATVAHEVRNPLAGIRSACEVMAGRYGDEDPHKPMALEVIRQVDRLNHTVEDLLVFARPRVKNPMLTDLCGLIGRAVSLLDDDPAHRDVRLEADCEQGIPALQIDPQQIEQVVLNLLLNAAQAAGPGGSVIARVRRVGDGIAIHVIDDGPGIPEDVKRRMFEPFFTTRTRGTGLGLAIVRNIVEAHGGRVRVESPAAGGTDVSVVLPRES